MILKYRTEQNKGIEEMFILPHAYNYILKEEILEHREHIDEQRISRMREALRENILSKKSEVLACRIIGGME